jgi:hypothetical protein
MGIDISQYENQDAPSDSQNGRVAELIKKVRHYRNEVPMDQFNDALPELRHLEKKCQDFDLMLGEPKINYIQEIMDALEAEQLRKDAADDNPDC